MVGWAGGSLLHPAKSDRTQRFFENGYFDSIAVNAYITEVSTLTIRNLDDTVKQKLRVRAAQHGRSMEAEVRDILTRDVQGASQTGTAKGKFDHLVGIWKGRMTTDEIMKITRGE